MDNIDIINPDRTWIINFDIVWPEKDDSMTMIGFERINASPQFFQSYNEKSTINPFYFVENKIWFDNRYDMV